ncbi:Protein kinase-like domain containing protein [Amanita muscaria]
MSFICLKQSITDFVRRSKKTKRSQRYSFLDDSFSSTMLALNHEESAAPEADEYSFMEDLHSAYHAPGTLDIHRTIKCGLDSPPLSMSVHLPSESVIIHTTEGPAVKANPTFDSSYTVKDVVLVPRTPMLPSTPIFEDSFLHSFDGLPSPCTPSLTCSTSPYSTPLFSSPSPNASTSSLSMPRILKIEDFKLLRFLSKGICGQVHLAKDTVSNSRLAIKIVKKDDDIFQISVLKDMLAQEKNIMVSLQGCEWFVQLQASWYDSKNIYFAMAYYPTDLESEIIRCDKLPTNRARFYMTEMIIALEELHSRGIVHRDIKAANILICADGHLVLADFGLSKDFACKPNLAERSYQPYWPFKTDDDVLRTACRSPEELTFVTDDICGSEVEMAPEILLEEYYSFGVDFWAAGITLYLMVTGKHPWTDDKEKTIQNQILEDDVEFSPEDNVGEECQDFIRQMLRKEPTERLRIGLDMTSHPYFAGVDWQAMKNRTVSPPWAPDFVSGHFYYEDWGMPELFEPGHEVKKDGDPLLSDFFFASPDLQKSIETPLCNFFSFSSEDQADGDKDGNPETLDATSSCEVLSTGQVIEYSPNVSMSDSHASMFPSFHSASSLQRLRNEGCLVDPPSGPPQAVASIFLEPNVGSVNSIANATLDRHANREAPIVRPAKHVVFAAASLAEPVLFTRPVLFRPVLEPLMECSESRAEFGSDLSTQDSTLIHSEVQDFVQAMQLVNKIVSWLKDFLPSPVTTTRNAFQATTVSRHMTIWKTMKWNFRKLLLPKVRHVQE